jgi:CIC family chloride channel protein
MAVTNASIVVRQLFGYSFATWRFHLRGETIRSAHDIGWVHDLTVGKLMRRNLPTVPADTRLSDFRRQFPLGSAKRVVAVCETDRYAGLVPVPEAHLEIPGAERVADLLQSGLASEKWRALSMKEEASDGRTQEAVYT